MSPSVVRVSILGSTGSIGTQALDVISRHDSALQVSALAASGRHLRLLAEQAVAFRPDVVGITDERAASGFARAWSDAGGGPAAPELIVGPEACTVISARPCDVVLNGLAGAAGLMPTLAALEAGHQLALANKESLIIGGPLVKAVARPGQIIPVDSEHSALAQCLLAGRASEVRRLVLTASGGPFRGRTSAQLATVTPEQALAHPTWDMGALVTINSATLVNKGLEVIEAHLLFDLPLDRIDVVVHPQSIVHSMVEFVDGTTMVQASPPDMRIPIALGLMWPTRLPDIAPACDWSQATSWEFLPLDEDVFPAVRIARLAAQAGGTGPAVFNGADEVCVEAFLEGRLAFPGIVATIDEVLQRHLQSGLFEGNRATLDDVLRADTWAREAARAMIGGQ